MNEKDLLSDLQQVDSLLARCTNPALKRDEHDSIRNVMKAVAQRVALSYRLEEDMKAQQEANKELTNNDKDEA